jgi:hypothetical protein
MTRQAILSKPPIGLEINTLLIQVIKHPKSADGEDFVEDILRKALRQDKGSERNHIRNNV